MAKTIFFDSGYTLNYPKTGNWFITPQTKNILGIDLLKIDKYVLNKTIQNILNVLEFKIANSIAEEISLFTLFYEKLLSELGYSFILSQSIYEELAIDLVKSTNKYIFYEDTLKLIPYLSSKYILGIISNAWPSLRYIYSYNNLYKYFSVFLISSELGILKPDLKIFSRAVEYLPNHSKDIIYIDDKIENVNAAIQVGMQGNLLNRKKVTLTHLLSELNML